MIFELGEDKMSNKKTEELEHIKINFKKVK